MATKGIRFAWDYNLTPEDMLAQADQLIEKARKVYDQVAEVKEEDVSYENVLKVLWELESSVDTEQLYIGNAKYIVVDKALREASTEAEKKMSDFDIEMSMREDIFKRLLALEKKKLNLPSELQRFLEHLLRDGRRNGLHLSEKERDEIKVTKKRLETLCLDFVQNVSEDSTCLEFTDEELNGLPKEFIQELEKTADNNKLKVTMKYPHYGPVMEKCRNPETRRKMELAFNARCIKENTPILSELLPLRHKQANLLGFASQAEFQCDISMSKTAGNVAKFLSELADKLYPLWEEEKKELLELKAKDCLELGIPFDGKLHPYDIRYLISKLKEMKFAVDTEKLRMYFPLPVVTKGLLEIYQTLLNVKFTEIENPHAWHPDVQLFRVEDAKDGRLMAYFYLDLFPREGKYSHNGTSLMQANCLLPDGSEQVALSAMICNFTKPTENKPSLLTHGEVITYFHEFGHVMHHCCCQVTCARFCGTRTETDFLEAPSQMLENWCWEPSILRMMSEHYETKEPIPEDLMESLIKTRLANTACFNLRQIELSTLDQQMHSSENADTQAMYHEIAERICGIPPTKGTNLAANFTHLCDGYQAKYYGYLWSEVFSMDMFYTKFKDNLLNPMVGREYRNKVIGLGGSKDASDMLRDFLGRDPNQDAFLISKGLSLKQ